jgi:hypothetical protein
VVIYDMIVEITCMVEIKRLAQLVREFEVITKGLCGEYTQEILYE